jgi:hypothetical protein
VKSGGAIAATESDEGEEEDRHPHPPLARPRWTFYATLLSTANITAESVGRLPRLVEFIHHRRREDDASILYARFDRRSRLTEVCFIIVWLRVHTPHTSDTTILHSA